MRLGLLDHGAREFIALPTDQRGAEGDQHTDQRHGQADEFSRPMRFATGSIVAVASSGVGRVFGVFEGIKRFRHVL